MFVPIIFVMLVLALVFWCGRVTARYAVRKGRSKGAWFLLGCLFFPFSSIVLALLPPGGEERAA